MRLPTSWNDRELLGDEPFLNLFFVREQSQESRTRRGSPNWNQEIVKELREVPNGLEAAEKWREIVFAAAQEQDSRAVQRSRISISQDNAALELFAECYWLLYVNRKSDHEAFILVNSARKKCGFRYLLSRNASQRVAAISALAIISPATNTSSAPSLKHGRRGLRKKKACMSPMASPEDPYDSEASHEEDTPEGGTSLHGGPAPTFPVALPAGGRDGSAMITPADEHEADMSSLDTVRRPASSASLLDSQDVVFLTESAESHRASIQGGAEVPTGLKRKISTDSSENATSEDDITSPRPLHTPLTAPSSTSDRTAVNPRDMSSLSELTVDTEPAHVKGPRPRRRRPRVVAPADCISSNIKRRPPRAASNSTKLSQMMQRETIHMEKVRRGIEDVELDLFADAEDAGGNVQESISTVKSRRKGSINVASVPEEAFLCSAPVDSSVRPIMLSQTASGSGRGTSARKDRLYAKAAPSARRNTLASRLTSVQKLPLKSRGRGSIPQPIGRPTKRRRGKDGEDLSVNANPIQNLVDAMAPQKQRRTFSRLQQQVDPAALKPVAKVAPLNLNDVAAEMLDNGDVSTVSRKRAKRKRTTSVVEDGDIQLAVEEPPHDIPVPRPTVKLPAGNLQRKRALVSAPSVNSLIIRAGQVHSLDEVDCVIRDSATEALMYQNNAPKPASDWEDEAEGQDEPPSSDEEDIPLSHVVPSHRLHPVEATQPSPAFPRPPPPRPCPVPAQKPILPKAPLKVRPKIWAESRQEVCESFDWFRSYQGGVYFSNDMVKGYLLSAFSSSRDLFERDGRVVISHGGGKAESVHTKEGQAESHEADDQLEGDKSVRALLKTYAMKRPLVLLIDDKYSLFPYDLTTEGYTYVVLGFYHIAYAWAERQPANNARGYVVRCKFAFQWCEEQGEPWWIEREPCQDVNIATDNPSTESIPRMTEQCSELSMSDRAASAAPQSTEHGAAYYCPECRVISPMIYEQGWMCLKPQCKAFWRTTDGETPPEHLSYADSFLQPLPCHHDKLEDLRPPAPTTEPQDGITTSRQFCKGWHCTNCGRLSSRYKWEHWECKKCQTTLAVNGKIRDPKEFWAQKGPEKFVHHYIAEDSGIVMPLTQVYKHNGVFGHYLTYSLPHSCGDIYLILGNVMANREADAIFREYQEQARDGSLRFRRWPLKSHKCRGTLLTNYFSQNTGEPYQYVGGTTNTVSFESAPSAIVRARDLIHARMQAILPCSDTFNEVLSAAYMEKQKMAFHSDSERGLGPTVATLSLGSGAYMHFRLHSQYCDDVRKGSNRNALTLYLRHGDVLVMHGANIQKYYEHTVIPLNFRIAATARYINNN